MQQDERRLKIQYFKIAVLRRKAEQNGFVVIASAAIIKRKRADKPLASWLRFIGSASKHLAL